MKKKKNKTWMKLKKKKKTDILVEGIKVLEEIEK